MATVGDTVRPLEGPAFPPRQVLRSVISDLASLELTFLAPWRGFSGDMQLCEEMNTAEDGVQNLKILSAPLHSAEAPTASPAEAGTPLPVDVTSPSSSATPFPPARPESASTSPSPPAPSSAPSSVPSSAPSSSPSSSHSSAPSSSPSSEPSSAPSSAESTQADAMQGTIAGEPGAEAKQASIAGGPFASARKAGGGKKKAGRGPNAKAEGAEGPSRNEPVTCQVACLSWAGAKDGFRKTNQDAYCFMRTSDKQSLLFGVFDGHGPNGRNASQAVKHRLPELLMESGDALRTSTAQSFVAAFKAMQDELTSQRSFECGVSGTTAVMAHLHQRRLTVAWTGDSRAVLASKAASGELCVRPLSLDHKPENPAERERIEASNGSVCRDVDERGEDVGPFRVWAKRGPMLGLAMSRSLGDRLSHTVGVSATPEVMAVELKPEDLLMVIASDGVWEFVSNEEAVKLVMSGATLAEGTKKLMQESKERWQAQDIGSYIDDITALAVSFTHQS